MSNKILVIEDSRTFRRHLERQLIQAGFEPITGASVKEAENILSQKNDYICAVLDYCLPDGEDGQVIDIVLKENITTIVFTAQFSNEKRIAMLEKGVFDYILKDNQNSVLYLIETLKRLKSNGEHTVLVVDDSITSRTVVNRLLKKQNLKTLQAKDGEEALEILCEHPEISLIITDNYMPRKDGITMTREIRNKYSHNQFMIIGISSSDEDSMTAQFLKAGANDFLYKPFNQEEFYCRVNNVLNFKDANDELYKIANQDALTGLWNRRYFFDKCGNNKNNNRALNLAMLDIDFFKKVNDSYGHDGGDIVLVTISHLIKSHFPDGIVARIGGEEFCVQQDGEFESFIGTLETMRKNIQAMVISYIKYKISVTISIGAVHGTSHIDQLLKIADTKLYKAKNNGRNLLVFEEDVEDLTTEHTVVRTEER